MDCDTGTMPPPAKPCRMRNKRSKSEFHACAQSTELMLKSPRHIRKKVLRPSHLARKGLAVRLIALATR